MVKGEDLWVWLAVDSEGSVRGHLKTHPLLQARLKVGVRRSYSDKHLDALSSAQGGAERREERGGEG